MARGNLNISLTLKSSTTEGKYILYGAGSLGRLMYAAFDERCIDVVAVIDKNVNDGDLLFDCPMISLEALEAYSYDYVVLTGMTRVVCNEMKSELMKQNVSGDMILSHFDICDRYMLCIDDESYTSCTDAKEQLSQLLTINQKCVGNSIWSRQFRKWCDLCYDLLLDEEAFVRSLKEELLTTDDTENQLFCCWYLYELKQLDDVGMQILVKAIFSIAETDVRRAYHMAYRLPEIELNQNKALYKDLGADRRALWKKIISQLIAKKEILQQPINRKKDYIAILTRKLMNEQDSPTVVYYYIIDLLCKIGKKVKVFVITYADNNEAYGPFELRDDSMWRDTENYISYNRQKLDGNVELEYIAEEDPAVLVKRAFGAIREYDPECIIDIMDGCCPITYLLYRDYPILDYPLRTCVAGTFFYRTMTREFPYNREMDSYRLPHLGVPYSCHSTNQYTKQDYLGIKEEMFVIVTAGNRLYCEISNALINSMVKLLRENDAICWVLVGDMAMKKMISKFDDVEDQILVLPFQHDLGALYKLCDVFLNPIRSGGGISISYAMQQGVAIATLKDNCHAAVTHLGEDNAIEGGYDELLNYVKKLYDRPEYLASEKIKVRERWEFVHSKRLDEAKEMNEVLDCMIKDFKDKRKGFC